MPAVGGVWRPLWQDGGNREASVGSTIGELTLLQRQHSLLQEELLRLRDTENRFKDSEKARAKLERQVRNMRVCNRAAPDSKQLEEQASQVRAIVLQFHKIKGPIRDTIIRLIYTNILYLIRSQTATHYFCFNRHTLFSKHICLSSSSTPLCIYIILLKYSQSQTEREL